MSRTELAEEVGVAQVTVGRWAAGDARPSVEKMLAAVSAVEDRIAEIQAACDRRAGRPRGGRGGSGGPSAVRGREDGGEPVADAGVRG